MLVFPEAALKWADLQNLKKALEKELESAAKSGAKTSFEIPLIIAGLRGGIDGNSRRNQVVFSAFFAGKWYDILQDKHHRWKLNDSQIKQYSLAGALNVQSEWWEGIDLHQRRLTFLAPNGWLTLCPLICEDLAQLEPVSDLIRGVGPTLLVAILMDGPQLTNRWSARYASVVADDPGTSVLTVTSLGMALRAKASGMPEDRTVALWKDQKSGWEPIKLNPDADAALLTISARWNEEFTADGRSDWGSAATFVLRGKLDLQAKRTSGRRRKGRPQNSEFTDVLELSIFSYLVDALIDLPGHLIPRVQSWAVAQAGADEDDEAESRSKFKPFCTLWERLMIAAQSYSNGSTEWPPQKFKYAVAQVGKIVSSVNKRSDIASEGITSQVERWGRLVKKSENMLKRVQRRRGTASAEGRGSALKPSEVNRLDRLVSLSILWAIHNRLKSLMHDSFVNQDSGKLTSGELQSVRTWLKYIEELQKKSAYFQKLP